jgi:hypothetical protein
MYTNRIFKFACFALSAIILGGCAIGVTRVKLDHDPLARVENKREGTILVEQFKDVRPKAKEYIGNKRNMYGMVLGHIGTEEGVNLTEVLTRYFAEALREAGYTVEIGKGSKAAKDQEKFDAMVEGEILTFWMDLYMAVWHKVGVKVMVKNPEGKILWEATVSGEETNVLWIGATGEYEKVIRQAITKAMNRAASEFASEPFYRTIKSEKHPTRKELRIEKEVADVDWPYKKEPAPPQIEASKDRPPEKEKPAPTSTFPKLPFPEYKISPPPANAPPEIERLLGKWQGYWISRVPAALVIQKVSLEEKKLECIYAWSPRGPNKDRKPGFRRLFAKLIPGPKPKVTFSLGKINFTFTLEGNLLKGTRELEEKINEIVMEKVE